MARKNHIIVGLDLGSIKDLCARLQIDRGRKLEVLGLGVAESKGWRKGVIVNLDLTMLAVKAVEAARDAAVVSIDSAYVGVGGLHIKAWSEFQWAQSRWEKLQTPQTREVERDQRAAGDPGGAGHQPPGRPPTTARAAPGSFCLIPRTVFAIPLRMVGARLEADIHLVTASISASQNVVTAVNRAGVVVWWIRCRAARRRGEACLTAGRARAGNCGAGGHRPGIDGPDRLSHGSGAAHRRDPGGRRALYQ